MRGMHFPCTHIFIRIMKSPTCRARQLVTEFLKFFDDEFGNAWIAPKNPIETNPDPLSLAAYEQAQRERDAFQEFHKVHSTLTTAESQCQCTLIDNGNQHILSKEISHESYAFDRDCGKSIATLVLKRICDSAMTHDASNDLIEGYFDHLFASLHSIPSTDQPGHGGCVCAGIAKWTHNEKVCSLINKV